MRRLFSSFGVKVQISDEYVTTGFIIVLDILNTFVKLFMSHMSMCMRVW
jgi:hypothetical protein